MSGSRESPPKPWAQAAASDANAGVAGTAGYTPAPAPASAPHTLPNTQPLSTMADTSTGALMATADATQGATAAGVGDGGTQYGGASGYGTGGYGTGYGGGGYGGGYGGAYGGGYGGYGGGYGGYGGMGMMGGYGGYGMGMMGMGGMLGGGWLQQLHQTVVSVGMIVDMIGRNANALVGVGGGLLNFLERVGQGCGEVLGVFPSPPVLDDTGREVPPAVLRKQKQLKLVRWAIGMAVVGFFTWVGRRFLFPAAASPPAAGSQGVTAAAAAVPAAMMQAATSSSSPAARASSTRGSLLAAAAAGLVGGFGAASGQRALSNAWSSVSDATATAAAAPTTTHAAAHASGDGWTGPPRLITSASRQDSRARAGAELDASGSGQAVQEGRLAAAVAVRASQVSAAAHNSHASRDIAAVHRCTRQSTDAQPQTAAGADLDDVTVDSGTSC